MIDVVSIRFKNRGKSYFFAPNGLAIKTGDKVIVETSKGLELADVSFGVHAIPDTAVVQPLRPVARLATQDDLRIAEINKRRESEAMEICAAKIAEHGLDMKLVDVECNFDGSKTTFYFTSDGRVDFRELVKDLAGIFRNRIELRQIGVRDEAKLLGGIGICGRPFCCSQFLDELQPVSTKMAKVQSLSLNPTKISGSCGKLMCCLRYEQEAYEDLVRSVPKQGAFVETKDGFGTAMQINLLRQTVKVKLDSDTDDNLHLYKANELCTVPGGRPKDGEVPVSTLKYAPEPEEAEEPEDIWSFPAAYVPDEEAVKEKSEPQKSEEKPERPEKHRQRQNRFRRGKVKPEQEPQPKQEEKQQPPKPEQKKPQPKQEQRKPQPPKPEQKKPQPEKQGEGKKNAEAAEPKINKPPRGKAVVKPVKVETPPAPQQEKPAAPGGEKKPRPHKGYYHNRRKPKPSGNKPKE